MTDLKKNIGNEYDSEKDKAEELKDKAAGNGDDYKDPQNATISEEKAKVLKDYGKVKDKWTEQHWEEKDKELKDKEKRDKHK